MNVVWINLTPLSSLVLLYRPITAPSSGGKPAVSSVRSLFTRASVMLDLDEQPGSCCKQPCFVQFVKWSSHSRGPKRQAMSRVAKWAETRQSDPVEVRGAIKVRAMAPVSCSHWVHSQLIWQLRIQVEGELEEQCSGDFKANTDFNFSSDFDLRLWLSCIVLRNQPIVINSYYNRQQPAVTHTINMQQPIAGCTKNCRKISLRIFIFFACVCLLVIMESCLITMKRR